jgi:hypothetical protein
MTRVTGLIAMTTVFLGSIGFSVGQDAPSWTDIGVLFEERCTMCHSGEGAPLGLRLDTLEGALAGSVNGPVLVPGDPDASELVRQVRGESQLMMPLAGEPLSPAEIGLVENWFREGLPNPQAEAEDTIPESPTAQPGMGEPRSAPSGQVTLPKSSRYCCSVASSATRTRGLEVRLKVCGSTAMKT